MMLISTNKRLLRFVRIAVEKYGFKTTYYPTPRTNLLMTRGADRLAITCLDSKEKLRSFREIADRIGGIAEEVFQDIKTRTLFVHTFAFSDAESRTLAERNICAVHVDDLFGLVKVLGLESMPLQDATVAQLVLAGQMSGPCRRFSMECVSAGDLRGAVDWRKKQAALKPQAPEAHWVMADLHAKLGELEEAEWCIRRFLHFAAPNIAIMLLLADIKLRQGDIASAKETADSAAAMFPLEEVAKKRCQHLAGMMERASAGFVGS